jgi:putative transposase
VVWKDKKAFHSDMKAIYNAPNKDAARMELEQFEQKWGSKYPYAIQVLEKQLGGTHSFS